MTTKVQHYARLGKMLEAAYDLAICTEACEPGLAQDIRLAIQSIADIGHKDHVASKRIAELCLLAFLSHTDQCGGEDGMVVRHIVRKVVEALRAGYILAEGETEVQPR